MRQQTIGSWPALAAVIFLAGCVTVPQDAGFAEVQDAVQERTGQRIQWDRGMEADGEVQRAIEAMLKKPLTAESAVAVALLNNQHLQATYEDLGIAQAELVEAGLLKNPMLYFEIRFPSHPVSPLELDLTQDFLDLFFIPLRKRIAGAAFESAKLRVTDAVLTKVAEVKAAYYRAQGADHLAELRSAIAQATEASSDAAGRLHKAGNITDLAFAGERALHTQAMIDLSRAQSEAREAREELSVLMGVWGVDTQWTIGPHLPDAPQVEVNAGNLESLAISRRLDLRAANEQVNLAAQSLALAEKSAWLKEANISGHFEREPDGAKTAGPGVEIPLPIFNQGQAAIAAAQARLRQNQRLYAAMMVDVRGQVRRAANRLRSARDRAEQYRLNMIPLQQQMVRQTQLQFNGMQVGVFKLLEAKRGEIDAGREYVLALQDYWVARAELERAVGGSLSLAMSQPATRPAGSTTQPATQTSKLSLGE